MERRAPDEAGPIANERLTATTAVVLIVLLFVEGVTILFLRPLLPVHIFVGMLLIPPVALKLATTGYRFARYYSRAPALGLGPSRGRGIVLGLHKASFLTWLAVATVHVLGYLPRLPRLVLGSGGLRRIGVVAASLAVGLTLAAGTFSMASPWVDHDGRHNDDRGAVLSSFR